MCEVIFISLNCQGSISMWLPLSLFTFDPACWLERWKLPRQRIDLCTASNLRSSSRATSRTCKETERRHLRPIALQRPSQWLNHQILREQEPCKSSLTVSSITRKRKECILNVRTSESSLRTLIYLVAFSLLAVTDLDTWLASNCTRAIIWSLLDLGAASDSLFG